MYQENPRYGGLPAALLENIKYPLAARLENYTVFIGSRREDDWPSDLTFNDPMRDLRTLITLTQNTIPHNHA